MEANYFRIANKTRELEKTIGTCNPRVSKFRLRYSSCGQTIRGQNTPEPRYEGPLKDARDIQDQEWQNRNIQMKQKCELKTQKKIESQIFCRDEPWALFNEQKRASLLYSSMSSEERKSLTQKLPNEEPVATSTFLENKTVVKQLNNSAVFE